MSIITAWLVNYGLMAAGGTIATVIIGWILAKIPTDKWAKDLGDAGQKHGAALTAFCRAKVPLWNKLIEPIFIDTITVLLAYVSGLIIGLKSDDDK